MRKAKLFLGIDRDENGELIAKASKPIADMTPTEYSQFQMDSITALLKMGREKKSVKKKKKPAKKRSAKR